MERKWMRKKKVTEISKKKRKNEEEVLPEKVLKMMDPSMK